jgi:gluconate 2-dehydrogenase gamma chain
MKQPSSLNRRKFLKTTAAVAAGTAAGCSASKSPWRFLTESEALALTAICEQIIPADDMPGAAWAGVVVYIDRQLTRKFKEHRQVYRDGIAAADRMAGGSFAGADAGRQLATLQQMEKDKTTKPFFELVVAHTMQGFYGSPRHGGNREYASWRMLGVPSTPVRGRDQYDFAKAGRS